MSNYISLIYSCCLFGAKEVLAIFMYIYNYIYFQMIKHTFCRERDSSSAFMFHVLVYVFLMIWSFIYGAYFCFCSYHMCSVLLKHGEYHGDRNLFGTSSWHLFLNSDWLTT